MEKWVLKRETMCNPRPKLSAMFAEKEKIPFFPVRQGFVRNSSGCPGCGSPCSHDDLDTSENEKARAAAGGKDGGAKAEGEVVGMSHVALGLYVLHFAPLAATMLESFDSRAQKWPTKSTKHNWLWLVPLRKQHQGSPNPPAHAKLRFSASIMLHEEQSLVKGKNRLMLLECHKEPFSKRSSNISRRRFLKLFMSN